MATPFNMPDEFLQGFVKAGQALLMSGTGTGVKSQPAAAGRPSTRFSDLQARYWEQQIALWTTLLASAGGKTQEPVVAAERGDRRFHAPGWSDNPWYSLLKQSYLLNARVLGDVVESAELDEREKHKLRFFTRQFIDSMSPANFAATNPDLISNLPQPRSSNSPVGSQEPTNSRCFRARLGVLEDKGSVLQLQRSAAEAGY